VGVLSVGAASFDRAHWLHGSR